MIQLKSNILRIANLILFGLLSIAINAETIYDITASNGNFSTLATALELTELDSVLDCEYFFCSYTVFAPSDDAFNALPDGTLDKLITDEWKAHLRGILLYHVAYGLFPSTGIQDKGQVITLSFETLNTTVANNEVKINDAIVTSADIEASNGLIHVIDKVLLPSFMQNDIIATATKAGIFGTLLAAVDAADLTQALQGSGPFTLFAPTDDAFQKLGDTKIQELLQDIPSLSEILTYHVIPEKIILSHDLNKESNLTTLQGESIQINKWKFWFFEYLHLNENVNIVSTDILTSNGVIHVIDTVLIPSSATPPPPTIAEILEADSNFATLTTALSAAELLDTFNSDGPFTLFAPTNAAFEKLGSEALDAVLANQSALSSILTYHVVPGEVMYSDLQDGAVETLNGADILVHIGFLYTQLNGNSYVIGYDKKASNGIIHTIDTVLIPPAGDCLAVAAENGLDSFLSAVDSAGLSDALSDSNATYTIFAPSNSAFDAIDLQSIDKDLLASVLKYHVLPITKISSDIKDGDTLSTLEGSDITVVFQYFLWIFFDGAYLNGKSLISTVDLMCSNGVIHIIDEVLEIPA